MNLFIQEFALGDKSIAVKHLVNESHVSKKASSQVDENEIYDEIASPEWGEYIDSVVSDSLLNYDSVA